MTKKDVEIYDSFDKVKDPFVQDQMRYIESCIKNALLTPVGKTAAAGYFRSLAPPTLVEAEKVFVEERLGLKVYSCADIPPGEVWMVDPVEMKKPVSEIIPLAKLMNINTEKGTYELALKTPPKRIEVVLSRDEEKGEEENAKR